MTKARTHTGIAMLINRHLGWVTGLFMAASAAFFIFAIPAWALGRVVDLSGLPSILPAAAPPLGDKARMLLAIVAGLGTGIISWFFIELFGGTLFKRKNASAEATRDDFTSEAEVEAPPRLRREDSHPDAPARKPISATDELGPPLDEGAYEAPVDHYLQDEENFAVPDFLRKDRVVDTTAEASSPAPLMAQEAIITSEAETAAPFDLVEPMATEEVEEIEDAVILQPAEEMAEAEIVEVVEADTPAPPKIAEAPVAATSIIPPVRPVPREVPAAPAPRPVMTEVLTPEKQAILKAVDPSAYDKGFANSDSESLADMLARLDRSLAKTEHRISPAASNPAAPLNPGVSAGLRASLDELKDMAKLR